MHREFLKLLKDAVGRSELVIVVNLDIRAFTPFCQKEDSANVAMYVTRVYDKIINDYFGNAGFYKPAGDGLIIVIPYSRQNLKEVAETTIDSCLTLLENFPSLCADNHMINFPTPERIGIGITRGNACCIHSEDEKGEDKILDYSGKILNLASRLMEMARPSGIVFDESFGIDLLEKTKELFLEENVYVRGIAEEDSIKIYYTKEHTLIPDFFKHPIKEPRWETVERKKTFGKLKDLKGSELEIKLPRKPLYNDKIVVRILYDDPKMEDFRRYINYYFDDKAVSFRQLGNTSYVILDCPSIVEDIEEDQVPDDTEIEINVIYPVK